jgi:hypothetical protein
MNLNFSRPLIIALFLSVILGAMISVMGRSNWYKGVQLNNSLPDHGYDTLFSPNDMMNDQQFWKVVVKKGATLNPVDRTGEVLFGLIMVLSFTGTISAATAGKQEIRELLWAALGAILPGALWMPSWI